jgi:DNA polymerase-4
VRKSVGAEDTFSQDIHSFEPAREGLQPLIEKVWAYCEANEIGAKTVTLKVKYADFSQITRSKTVLAPLPTITDLEEVVDLLLAPIFPPRKGIRLLGVTLSSLEERRASRTAPQCGLRFRPPASAGPERLNGARPGLSLMAATMGNRPRRPINPMDAAEASFKPAK